MQDVPTPAEVEAPVEEPVGPPSTAALEQASLRESISVQEPSALRSTDPAPSGAAFDIWLAMAPDTEAEKEDALREAEGSRSRWIRPIEVLVGLLLVLAVVVLLLVLFA